MQPTYYSETLKCRVTVPEPMCDVCELTGDVGLEDMGDDLTLCQSCRIDLAVMIADTEEE